MHTYVSNKKCKSEGMESARAECPAWSQVPLDAAERLRELVQQGLGKIINKSNIRKTLTRTDNKYNEKRTTTSTQKTNGELNERGAYSEDSGTG